MCLLCHFFVFFNNFISLYLVMVLFLSSLHLMAEARVLVYRPRAVCSLSSGGLDIRHAQRLIWTVELGPAPPPPKMTQPFLKWRSDHWNLVYLFGLWTFLPGDFWYQMSPGWLVCAHGVIEDATLFTWCTCHSVQAEICDSSLYKLLFRNKFYR
jgi:hypothetical protein